MSGDKGVMGYRDLSADDVTLINQIKEAGECLGVIIQELEACPASVDQRWVAIGRTHLQEGIMALVRAVARPTTF